MFHCKVLQCHNLQSWHSWKRILFVTQIYRKNSPAHSLVEECGDRTNGTGAIAVGVVLTDAKRLIANSGRDGKRAIHTTSSVGVTLFPMLNNSVATNRSWNKVEGQNETDIQKHTSATWISFPSTVVTRTNS
jgi:hypothetical protein